MLMLTKGHEYCHERLGRTRLPSTSLLSLCNSSLDRECAKYGYSGNGMWMRATCVAWPSVSLNIGNVQADIGMYQEPNLGVQ